MPFPFGAKIMGALAEACDAIQKGELARLKELLADDSSLRTARTETDVSLFMLACYCRRPEMADLLAADRPLDVFEATALGQSHRVADLCRQQPELVHTWSPDGFQPIHLAAFFGHADCVAVLLQLAADVNLAAKNPMGVRPIHSAVASRNVEVVHLLVAHGADVNVKQHGGWTPLHAAALHGDESLVRFLLDHGADPLLASDNGKTAADLASANGHAHIAALLR